MRTLDYRKLPHHRVRTNGEIVLPAKRCTGRCPECRDDIVFAKIMGPDGPEAMRIEPSTIRHLERGALAKQHVCGKAEEKGRSEAKRKPKPEASESLF